jgi:hypothetical protein
MIQEADTAAFTAEEDDPNYFASLVKFIYGGTIQEVLSCCASFSEVLCDEIVNSFEEAEQVRIRDDIAIMQEELRVGSFTRSTFCEEDQDPAPWVSRLASDIVNQLLGLYMLADKYLLDRLKSALISHILAILRSAWKHSDILGPLTMIIMLPREDDDLKLQVTQEIRLRIFELINESKFKSFLTGELRAFIAELTLQTYEDGDSRPRHHKSLRYCPICQCNQPPGGEHARKRYYCSGFDNRREPGDALPARERFWESENGSAGNDAPPWRGRRRGLSSRFLRRR